MEYARAMALGGQRVYADNCDFSSSDKLKLLCDECREPVYLRKGNIRKPYFAHHHATSSRQVEECKLRISTDSNSTETSSLIENRGQRLEIFQQHFLSLIYVEQEKIVDDVKFNNWIDSIKRDNNQPINNIANDCIEYFLTHQKQMEVYCVYLKDDQPLLQQQIALEAIDYLCVKSSYRLLKYIIYYCIYQLDKQNLTKNNIDSICHRAIKIIMLNPWIKALDNSKSINSLTINASQLFKPEIVKIQSPSPLQISSQNIQNASKLDDLEQVKVNSKWIGSGSIDIDINQINATERHALENKLDLQLTFPAWEYSNVDKETGLPSRQKVFVYCKLITEVNPDDKTALRFSFMTSQNVNVKVTTENYLPAVVYSFGYDFSLTVEKYSDLLFAKNGKLMEYPHITKRDELASLVERMIKDNKVEFIKTYIDHKGKKRVLHTYDDTVLILLALKRRTQLDNISMASTTDVKKGTYNQIENQIVMEAFIEAYERSLECSVILPNTTIDKYHRYAQFKLTELNTTKEREPVVTEEPVVDYVGEQCVFPTNYKIAALSNSREFGVSSTVMGGKKQQTPIIYSMVIEKGQVTIVYHYSEKIKNPLTEQTETTYKKRQIATITAAPGTLKITFEKITLDKLAFNDFAFHHELLEQYSIPFWIMNAENYVLSNKLPPVWLITSKLIEFTCIDENTGKLDLNSLQNTLPFTEIQWYQTLIGCHAQCPSVPQFTNAVNALPEKFRYLINPVDI